MAPDLPNGFVPRAAEFEKLKAQLLDARGDAVGITAALRGAGGYGKTVLANALCHDLDIQDAYFDGILRVELGEPDSAGGTPGGSSRPVGAFAGQLLARSTPSSDLGLRRRLDPNSRQLRADLS